MDQLPIDVPRRMSHTDPVHPWPIPSYDSFQDAIARELRPSSGVLTNSVFRLYNKAVVEWCEAVTEVAGTAIPCIMSSPLRAFADFGAVIERRLKKPWPQLAEDQNKMDRHPLPFGCVTPGATQMRPSVQNDCYPIRNIGIVDTSGKRRTAFTRYPKPIVRRYDILFFCRHRNHSDYIEQKLMGQFWNGVATWSMPHPLAVLNPLDTSGVLDKMQVRIRYASHTVTDDLTGDMDADRVIKIAFSVDVDAWIWFDILQAPTALRHTEVLVDVEDKDGLNPEAMSVVSVAVPEAPPSVVDINDPLPGVIQPPPPSFNPNVTVVSPEQQPDTTVELDGGLNE